jgi:hypothetical protein
MLGWCFEWIQGALHGYDEQVGKGQYQAYTP